MSTPPNPQSPTPEAKQPSSLVHAESTTGVALEYPVLKVYDTPTPSPTLQAAAEGAAKELNQLEGDEGFVSDQAVIKVLLRHFSFVEELEKQRNEAMADYDRVALTNAELRADLNRARQEASELRGEVEKLAKKQPINTHRRLFDLVRFMRSELHEQDLIDTDEYAWLCQHEFPEDKGKPGSPSPRRLEDYDDMRQRLAAADEMAVSLGELLYGYEDFAKRLQTPPLKCAENARNRFAAYQSARNQGGQ